jgi:hypothetical protein
MSKKIGFDLQMTGREVEREESKKGDKEWHHRTLMMFNGIIIKFIFIISVYSSYLIPLFSSPDPKGQVSYCHHFASVVRLSVHQTFSKIFSSETTEPFVTKHCTNDH